MVGRRAVLTGGPAASRAGREAGGRPEAQQAVAQMTPFIDDFDLAWQRFLECGGFPRAVGEYHRAGVISALAGLQLMGTDRGRLLAV